MSLSRICVTGSEGFIASYLLPELRNHEVIGLDIKSGNDILECDLPDADVVIHLAAEPGVIASMAEPYKNARTNILGTIRLLKRYPDAKFIFSSSGGTIQETIESPYGLSKKTCEEYIKLLHSNYVILRFPNVYGKGSRSVADKFLNNEVVIYGDGSATRTYGHVDDIVRAVIGSMEWQSNDTYKLGSPQNYSVKQIAEAIGKPITYEPKRKGELDHSKLPNTTPHWLAKTDLLDYLKSCLN